MSYFSENHYFLSIVLFNLVVIVLLLVDLCLLHKKPRAVKMKEALLWSGGWIFLALLFNLGLYFVAGAGPALDFFTAYLVEKSLSIDNIFVFLVIFKTLSISSKNQHKILFWGILGAIVMRALFIALGITLIQSFHFILYFLALFLIVIGFRILFGKERQIDPRKNWVLRFLPIKKPFWVALILIESTDVLFALDSIPAVLAITLDPFVAYTSNIMAILGLRALYFVLAKGVEKFTYLHYALGSILLFIGFKMLFEEIYPISTLFSLMVISLILLGTGYATLRARHRR